MMETAPRIDNLSAEERRALLARLLRERVAAAGPAPFALINEDDRRGLPDGVEDAYPLTTLQRGMLFHSELDPESGVYHDIFQYRVRAPLDLAALEETGRLLAARHPVLRTSFDLASLSEPLQRVHREVSLPVEAHDLRALDASGQAAALAAWLEAEKRWPFDWARPPLLRLVVHALSEGTFQVALSLHHAILDGWSVATLVTELFRLYRARLDGKESPLEPPPAVTFAGFVALERRALETEEFRRHFTGQLADANRTRLPRWPGHRPGREGAVATRAVAIPAGVSAGISQLARSAGVPVKAVLLAAHLRVLSLLSGQAGVLTGLVTNGRPEETGGDRVLGLFLNTLPLRADLPGGTWLDLARQAFDLETGLLPLRRFPLAEIQRGLGGEPLFETAFNFMNFHIYQGLEGLGLQILGGEVFEATNFTLMANFRMSGQEVGLDLAYARAELDPGQIDLIGSCYGRVLEAMSAAPDSRYETADLLPGEDRERLAAWNATQAAYDLERPLHAWIEARAQETPEAVAVEAEEGSLTYRELVARVRQLAHHLQGLGVGLESRVAICAERSLEMVVGLLGILEAGAAYVPLDPSYPAERLAYMLEDSRAAVLLTQERLLASLPATDAPVVCLDAGWEEIRQTPQEAPLPAAGPYNLAYAIYTSGSTGRPKGAMVPHRGIVNRLVWKQEAYGLQPEDRVLQKTPFSFDVSVWEFFWPLMVGARLVMARPEGHKDPQYLAETIQRAGITTLHFVPAMLRMFLDEPEAVRCRGLRRVLCSGEALPPALVERFHAVLPGVELHNLYGPTESSVDVTAWPCEGDPEGLVPIGRPIANIQIRVLDGEGMPLPVGSPGELHIAGVGLGRGYLGRPELTAEKFVPDPWGEAGSRLYKTGDLARWLPDGSLEYLGRIDHQVKIRGFRIELGEIESVLGQHPGVSETVVVARDGAGAGESRLVAYLAMREGFDPAVEELRSHLRQHLPEHMVPAVFVRLPALPLSPNGKVDRKALPQPDSARPELLQPYVAPRTAVETELAEIWAGVLGVERIGAFDNFFELGGQSLVAVQAITRLRDRFGVSLSLRTLFDAPTLAALAYQITLKQAEQVEEESLALLLEEIEGLSEEDAHALLADQEAR